MKRSAHHAVAAAMALMCGLAVGQAYAQTPLTPEQRRAAGAAYDQGVAARASGDHAGAANFFETADRIAPSTQALGNAIREHRDAHTPRDDARAATLAARMLGRYPNDARAGEYARNVISELAPSLTRVHVVCQGCVIEVVRAVSPELEFFVEPGHHTVVAFWGQTTRTREFDGTAGSLEQFAMERPAGGATTEVAHGGASSGPPGGHEIATTQDQPVHGFIPVPVTVVLGVLTLASGGVLAWSAYDMYQGVGPYMMNPTQAGLDDGRMRELRTDILIGTTIGLGALTLLTLPFLRRGGGHVEAAPTVQGAAGTAPGLTIAGRF